MIINKYIYCHKLNQQNFAVAMDQNPMMLYNYKLLFGTERAIGENCLDTMEGYFPAFHVDQERIAGLEPVK